MLRPTPSLTPTTNFNIANNRPSVTPQRQGASFNGKSFKILGGVIREASEHTHADHQQPLLGDVSNVLHEIVTHPDRIELDVERFNIRERGSNDTQILAYPDYWFIYSNLDLQHLVDCLAAVRDSLPRIAHEKNLTLSEGNFPPQTNVTLQEIQALVNGWVGKQSN
jgi:hypothetical protein